MPIRNHCDYYQVIQSSNQSKLILKLTSTLLLPLFGHTSTFKTQFIICTFQLSCIKHTLLMENDDKLLIILGTFIVVGYGYSSDMPQALEVPLRQPPYNFDSFDFNLIYFATYVPILVTDIPIGVLLDKFPLQKTVVVIAITSFIAEFLTAIVFDFRPQGYLYMVYLLRAIMGMAGSSAFTMQGFIIARYASEYYELITGIALSVPFIFDSINVTIAPLIFDNTKSISLPWYIASFVDFLAILCSLWISYLVTKKERRQADQIQQSMISVDQQAESQQQQQQEQFKCNYLIEMLPLFWIVNFTIFIAELILGGLFSNLNDLIVQRFKFEYVFTGNLLLIPYVLGSIVSAVFGKMLMQKPNWRRTIILISSIMMLVGNILLYVLPNSTDSEITTLHYVVVVIFLVMMSVLSGSIYTVLCSSVSVLADSKRLGTAWGVVGTAIALGQTMAPIINGFVQQSDTDLSISYKSLNLVYTIICGIVVALSLVIYFGPFSIIDMNLRQKQNKEKKDSLIEASDSENQPSST